MIINCQNIKQKKIINCLLEFDSLDIYKLMNLTLIPKTTIIDNINKFYKLILKSKVNLGKRGRPITNFYISKTIRNAFSIAVIIDNSIKLKYKTLNIPKLKRNKRINKRDNSTNHLHSIKKPKVYILPKKIYIIEKPIHLKFINEV